MNNITNKQLLFDRQESFNDIVSCLVAMNKGIGGYEERLDGNLSIINTINTECEKRGFDPAIFQGDVEKKIYHCAGECGATVEREFGWCKDCIPF